MISALETEKLLRSTDVFPAPLASLAQLSTFHPRSYLGASAQRDTLATVFGIAPELVDIDCVLRAQRRAVGGTVAAAEWVVASPRRLAFNLGGGFHHAEPEAGAGFCVYNDVAVAVRWLRRAGFSAPIAIVDLDVHQGDGNLVGFANDPTVVTYSIHGSVWSHVEAVADHQILLPAGTGDADYLDTLRTTLAPMMSAHRPALIFYIAGTDVLRGDELGSFALSHQGVFQRDLCVLREAERVGAGVVVTLAGGYSRHAWWSSANLLRFMLTGRAVAPPPPAPEDPRLRFNRIAAILDPFELQTEKADDWTLSEAEVMEDLSRRPALARRFLGYYSVQGVELALEKYGLLEQLRRKGFTDLRVAVDLGEGDRQRLTVHGHKVGRFHLLVDVVVARTQRKVKLESGETQRFTLLLLDWLQLQDPTRTFSLRQPPLPGQTHPGLGMARETMELLYQAGRRLQLDGLMVHPAHYHIAALARGTFFFLDPQRQGRLDALVEGCSELPVAEVSRLIEEKQVVDDQGVPWVWESEELVAPITESLRSYLRSEVYLRARAEAKARALARGVNVPARDRAPARA